MNDIIQFNKFCDLHDAESIIFCKTDYLASEFLNIKQLDNEVVLISGNSDYSINDEVASKMPANIKKWFCHNNLSEHPKLEAIPMGIENSKAAVRSGHGVGWPHAVEKEKFISYFFLSTLLSLPDAGLLSRSLALSFWLPTGCHTPFHSQLHTRCP